MSGLGVGKSRIPVICVAWFTKPHDKFADREFDRIGFPHPTHDAWGRFP